MSFPRITVVTVVFNAEKIIKKTIQSVLSQNYPNLEYIVVDGKSQDRTIEIIKQYVKIDKVISEPDRGIYDAMNKGLLMATGEWVLFMNAGDLFCNPNVLRDLELGHVKKAVSVVYGDSIYVYGKDHFYFPAKDKNMLRDSGMPFCHQAVLVRRTVLAAHPFDLSYKLLADYNLFRTLLLENFMFEYKTIPVCIYNVDGGLTDSSQWLCRREMNRILHRDDSIVSRCFFFLKSFTRRFLRPCNQLLRRYKYKKNLIRDDQISHFIY